MLTYHKATRHPLLDGRRWHLARPRSRALWTAATHNEVAALSQDARLRGALEQFLGRVTTAVDDVDTLLVFDQECDELVVSLTGSAWNWG